MRGSFWPVAFLLFALACVGFWSLAAATDWRSTETEVNSQASGMLRLMDIDARRTLTAGDELVRRMAVIAGTSDLSNPATAADAYQRVLELVEQARPVTSALILDVAGNAVVEVPADPSASGPPVDGAYVEEHRSGGGGLLIGSPDQLRTDRPSRFTLSRPIAGPQGEFAGVAVAALDAAAFESYYKEASPTPGTVIRLVLDDGLVLAAWPNNQAPQTDETPLQKWAYSALARLLGESAHGMVIRSKALSDYPVVVQVAVPIRPALVGWSARTGRSGLAVIAALVGFGILAMVGHRATRREAQAMVKLSEAHDRLEDEVQERTADLRRRESALSISEARYRALVEAIAAVVWTAKADGEVVDMPDWRALTGQTSEEVKGVGWLDAVHPEDRPRVAADWREAAAGASVCDSEYRIKTRDGQYRWYNGRGVPVFDKDGKVDEYVGLCIDIDERKAAEERQLLLMAELDHRVRNILATVQSMVSLTGRSADSKEAFATTLHGRVAAMARTHGLLTRGGWKGASVAQIIRDELAPYRSGEAISLIGDERIALRPKTALSMALILHELATNAAKYGALSVPRGRLRIAWSIHGQPGGRKFKLEWRESGGPAVKAPERRGFGSSLIENALGKTDDTAVKLDFHPKGVRWMIEMPADKVVEDHQEIGDGKDAGDGATRADLMAAPLNGVRVLVVEDEVLVAADIEQTLEEAGAVVLGPASTIREAEALVDDGGVAIAVLDVNVRGELIVPLAETLRTDGVPLIFVTGYNTRQILPESLRDCPSMQKPFQPNQLVEWLEEIAINMRRNRVSARLSAGRARPARRRAGSKT